MPALTLFDFDATPEPRFDPPAARRTDPETSVQAAELAKLGASEGRLKAARALAQYGAQTDFDLAKRTGVGQTSIGKRRLELQRAGYVRPTGQRRPSPTGALALVWVLTVDGARWLAAQEEGR